TLLKFGIKFFLSLLILFLSFGPFNLVLGQLNLEEANVTEVTFVKISDNQYELSVTLFHDDDGEEGYADYWQVEMLNGTILGKRILLHAHGTVEFTRSTIVIIPDYISYVVVRGHDMTHGFGGQVMLVELTTERTHKIDQGMESLDMLGSESVFQTISITESSSEDIFTSSLFGLEITTFMLTLIIISFYRFFHKRKL
ncbi:MAG: hypothetical protein ACW967_06725, partial [Candidatus Hodarchaeales archaeon]